MSRPAAIAEAACGLAAMLLFVLYFGVHWRYGVTKILLTPQVRNREAELTLLFGPPIARTAGFTLFVFSN